MNLASLLLFYQIPLWNLCARRIQAGARSPAPAGSEGCVCVMLHLNSPIRPVSVLVWTLSRTGTTAVHANALTRLCSHGSTVALGASVVIQVHTATHELSLDHPAHLHQPTSHACFTPAALTLPAYSPAPSCGLTSRTSLSVSSLVHLRSMSQTAKPG